MTGYHTIRGGRLKCDFCDHASYKTQAGIISHLSNTHPHELEIAKKDAEIKRLKSAPPKVEIREKIVYKDKPKPKYWYHSVFCLTCKEVIVNAGIPTGQSIETTPHSVCGTMSLVPVEKGL